MAFDRSRFAAHAGSQHAGPIPLQSLIDHWSESQVWLHALVSEPPAVLIQINRFPDNPT